MSNETVSFLSDFFGDLFEPIVPYPKQGMRILHKVRNGKSFLWYCTVTETYWKTLKACRALTPNTQRVKNPRCKGATQ